MKIFLDNFKVAISKKLYNSLKEQLNNYNKKLIRDLKEGNERISACYAYKQNTKLPFIDELEYIQNDYIIVPESDLNEQKNKTLRELKKKPVCLEETPKKLKLPFLEEIKKKSVRSWFF